MKKQSILSITLLFCMLAACTREQVDLLVINGKIYTVDNNFTVQEAMAIRDGKVYALGNSKELSSRFSADSTIDLQGQTIYPGFIDAHSHFYGYASDLLKCDVTGTTGYAEILDSLVKFAATNQFEWILGRGWDQNDWTDNTFPDKTELDRLFPDKPVFLMRIDGHAAICNKTALLLAGINANTHVEGGEVVLKNGEPTGLLIDNAIQLAENKIPSFSNALNADALVKAQANCFAAGLTSVCDAGLGKDSIELIQQLQKDGRIKIRVYAMIRDSKATTDYYFKKGPITTERLTVRAVKTYLDGALGSRGALLKKPYSDQPGHFGLLLHPYDALNELADEAMEHGFQLCTHAIGDSGVAAALKIYDNHLHQHNDRRWRIEHCQVVDPKDLSEFKKLSIIPSVQPTHATSDMYWAEKRLGQDRIQTAYCYQDLLKKTDRIAFGTDFPVEKIDPLLTFHAAVARKDEKEFPAGGFQSKNKVSRKDALRAMTIWAAYANFENEQKGSLEPGKVADFVILDQDLLSTQEDHLLKTRVVATYVNGELVYRKQ